jgi:lipopolysaccharide transport system permease protein
MNFFKNRYALIFQQLLVREIGERYRDSALGVLWHLILPLCQLFVLSWVFGYLLQARVTLENVSYAAFLALGLWPWNLFSNAVSQSVTSLSGNAALIGKVLMPHGLLVASRAVSSVLLDLAGFAVVLLVLLMLSTPLKLSGIPTALLGIAVLCIFVMGIAQIVAVLNVFLRDVAAAISQLLSLFFFLTPIIYDVQQLPESLQTILRFNPLCAPIVMVRNALLGLPLDFVGLAISALLAVAVFLLGVWLMRRTRRHLEDYL